MSGVPRKKGNCSLRAKEAQDKSVLGKSAGIHCVGQDRILCSSLAPLLHKKVWLSQMPRKKTTGGTPSRRPIERYEHSDKKRINNPPVGLVTPETDPIAPTHKIYDYVAPVPSVKPRQDLDYDPHLDPQLVWAGKKEHSSFEVPTVSLHVHERIDPHTIINAVRKRNGTPLPVQASLFERREENPPFQEAIDFYRHAHGCPPARLCN